MNHISSIANDKDQYTREWKEKNKKYLEQLQTFLDVADNIEEEDLRRNVITQMLKCDLILTELAEIEFSKFYDKGRKSQ